MLFQRSLVIALLSLPLTLLAVASADPQAAAVGSGALYQINNNADFNAIIVWRLNSNGSLQYVKQVPAGGAGSGPLGGAGSDPLASQGTIAIEDEDFFTFNANSSTVVYFRIDRRDPTKLNFIDIAPTNGEFPVSVTANEGTVCVLTGGRNNGIRCWSYCEETGLTLMPSWDRSLATFSGITANPPGPLALSQVSFSPRGNALVVTIRGNVQTGGQVLVYPITRSGLASEPIVTRPAGAVGPFGFAFLGNQNILVAADPHGPTKPAGVTVVSFSASTGESSYAQFQPYTRAGDAVSAAPCWAVYSPLSETVIALDAGTSLATLLSFDRSLNSTAVASVNLGKSVFEAARVAAGRRLERWYVNTPRNGASVSTFTVAVQRGVITAAVGPSYSAPASANVGVHVEGVAVYTRDDRD